MCLQVKICYQSLILMKFDQHIFNIYGQFFMLKWYSDKDCNMLKFEFQNRLNTKLTVENWGTMA